jgi:hypothetical protein
MNSSNLRNGKVPQNPYTAPKLWQPPRALPRHPAA